MIAIVRDGTDSWNRMVRRVGDLTGGNNASAVFCEQSGGDATFGVVVGEDVAFALRLDVVEVGRLAFVLGDDDIPDLRTSQGVPQIDEQRLGLLLHPAPK